MDEVTVHEAKTQLSRLLRRVEAGEEILIRRGSEPVARLVPARDAGDPPVLWGDLKGAGMGPDFDEIPEDFSHLT